MNCEWVEYGDKFRCSLCGFVVKSEKIRRNCPTKKNIPSLLQRGVNLGQAIVKHVQTGFQHCTEEQKRVRFEICRSNKCGLFKVHGEGGICAHEDCGCYIRSNGRFMDKLSWAESKCPKEMWDSVNPISEQ